MAKARRKAKPKPEPRGLSDDASKGEVIRFRCTSEQRELLIAAAKRESLDVSSWLRRLALQAAREIPGADTEVSAPEKPRR